MSPRHFRNALFAVLALGATSALAQGALTSDQIVIGLVPQTAVTVIIDPAALEADAQANIGKGVAKLPSWSQLASLTQFVVEINFVYNSVAIVPESYRNLGLIADALHHPLLLGYKFLIVGHTDSTGDAKYNLGLSLRRAQAIQTALSTTFCGGSEAACRRRRGRGVADRCGSSDRRHQSPCPVDQHRRSEVDPGNAGSAGMSAGVAL